MAVFREIFVSQYLFAAADYNIAPKKLPFKGCLDSITPAPALP